MHDPAKVLTDLAMSLAPGGDCLADIAVLRRSRGSTGGWRRMRPCRAPSMRWPRTPPGAGAISGQRLSYSVGFGLPANTEKLLALLPNDGWQVAYDSDGSVRDDGAWVAGLTGVMDLTGWPKGMCVIARTERPHPGAQLRITGTGGLRVTAFATNAARGQLADLELRHRRRAPCEDRIRNAKDTGLNNLPLHDMDQNRIWCALVSLACELTAWLQMLTSAGHAARRWEPKRLRLRLFSVAGRLATSGRRGPSPL